MSTADQTKRPAKFKILFKRFSGNPLALAGAFFFFFFFLMALIGPYVAPYSFEAQTISERLKPPSISHLCGTDQFGRDVFSRIIAGARSVFFLGGTGTIIAAFFGLILGLSSGYRGGSFDELAMRLCDIIISFP